MASFDVIPALDEHHVQTDFTEPAEGNEANGSLHPETPFETCHRSIGPAPARSSATGTILGYPKGMRRLIVTVLAGLLAGCTSSYWSRPGATLQVLATESDACYRSALDFDAPSALPGPTGRPLLLPRSTPPPKLWQRAPWEASFEHFDEQLRYERCMSARGWEVGRAAAPAL